MPTAATMPMHILLVDDNPDDAFLTQEAFEILEEPPAFTVCQDGLQALELLRHQLEAQEPLPDLMLVDLNMPRMDGFGLLEQIKLDPVLRLIPVLILSTSDAREDVVRSYENYANSYICKPRSFGEYAEVVEAVRSFWLKTACLPR